jgi:2-keto-3-deoxy-L-rhamnonate aldolase RhmA
MLKTRISQGETLVGTFVFLPSPALVEIIAKAGFDFIIIDMEHSPKDWSTVEHMIRAANIHGLPVLIRVSENSEKLILQCLEIGADGIVLPFVQTAEQVTDAANAVYYPPKGKRGTCTVTRVTGYGAHRQRFLEHCREQNERLVIVAQIEDIAGVENIDAIIAADPGIDVVLLGRSDLASALGAPGQVDDPRVMEASDRMLTAIRNAPRKVAASVGAYTSAEVARWTAKGCTIFFAASEGLLFFNAATNWLKDVRAGAEQPRVAKNA